MGEKALEKVSDRHLPNVILFFIIIYLVLSFIVMQRVIIVTRTDNIYFNANHEAGIVLSVFHGETRLLLIH